MMELSKMYRHRKVIRNSLQGLYICLHFPFKSSSNFFFQQSTCFCRREFVLCISSTHQKYIQTFPLFTFSNHGVICWGDCICSDVYKLKFQIHNKDSPAAYKLPLPEPNHNFPILELQIKIFLLVHFRLDVKQSWFFCLSKRRVENLYHLQPYQCHFYSAILRGTVHLKLGKIPSWK